MPPNSLTRRRLAKDFSLQTLGNKRSVRRAGKTCEHPPSQSLVLTHSPQHTVTPAGNFDVLNDLFANLGRAFDGGLDRNRSGAPQRPGFRCGCVLRPPRQTRDVTQGQRESDETLLQPGESFASGFFGSLQSLRFSSGAAKRRPLQPRILGRCALFLFHDVVDIEDCWLRLDTHRLQDRHELRA
ncbi:MAG: hypothetical protein ACE5IR_25830 [bacterium]